MARGAITQALTSAFHKLLWGYSKWLLVALLIAYFSSGFYKIEQNAVGVLTRFGQVADASVSPGLHYKLPWPIDRIQTVAVKQVKTMVINDFGSQYMYQEGGASHEFYKNTYLRPYCITGDNNLVAMTLVIKYTIDDPVRYLFGVKQPEYLVERTAARLIVNNIAKLKIEDVLTIGKKQLEFNLQKALAENLEQFRPGIRVSFLEIKEIKPPRKVQDEFDRVINAVVNKKKDLDEAQGYCNRIVPEARSAANKLIQEAHAYKREKILTAEGETARFLSRLEGFKQNPKAHRRKLYLEFAKELYPSLKEIRVVDSKTGADQIFYLPN